MTKLVVLGFASRELAEQARSRGRELREQGRLDLDGAAMAYCRDDGRVELVQPLNLMRKEAVQGGVTGGLIGFPLLAPLLFAAVGAAAGAAGAGLSSGILNHRFVNEVKQVLEPGGAALFLVVDLESDLVPLIDVLRPFSPRVLKNTLSEAAERRLLAAFGPGSG
jgi:uncharacterized membrane protein